MYANPPDDPRERLNYSNGQRLAASDFRAEQGHHDGMRRVLNRSLYSSGIVTGLEVELSKSTPPVPADRHRVVVKRGLAFDHLGREIFLPENVFVQTMGAPSTTPGLVFGNLLVISYREQRKNRVSEGCAVTSAAASCSSNLAWGAPTRIAADAVFEVLDSWPAYESGKVVIAQLELNAQCHVDRVLPGARQYAVPVKAQKVRPISLEGEKDIDIANEKTLHFHIEGGAPERAVLILRARKFSSLFYSEIGKHVHDLSLSIPPHDAVAEHQHGLDHISTNEKLNPATTNLKFFADVATNHPSSHAFLLWHAQAGNLGGTGTSVDTESDLSKSLRPQFKVKGTEHKHEFEPGQQTGPAGGTPLPLEHPFNKQVTEPFGSITAANPQARSGKPEYTYIRNLHVVLDGHDVTVNICEQLRKRAGEGAKWDSLGDGTPTHAIASDEGTREIDLLALGFELGMGPHKLSFRLVPPKPGDLDFLPVPADRGGQIQYNLYID